jgi:hypothetical protein
MRNDYKQLTETISSSLLENAEQAIVSLIFFDCFIAFCCVLVVIVHRTRVDF